MRQSIFPRNNFDKEGFANLLQKAKGSSTIAELSRNCGVSYSFLIRYFNQTAEKPPVLDTLYRMSAYTSLFDVSFEDLATAAGYTSEDMKKTNTRGKKKNTVEPLFLSIITNSLAHARFRWSHQPDWDYDDEHIVYSVSIDADSITDWNFIFYPITSGKVYDMQSFICAIVGKLVMSNFKRNAKLSIVTDNQELFEALKNRHYYRLASFVSIILVDLKTMSILEETYLDTSLELNDGVRKYTLA